MNSLLSLFVGSAGGEVFSGQVTSEPRPTHPEERVQNEWRVKQYRARLERSFLAHSHPEFAELEVARRADQGVRHLQRLQLHWDLPRAAANQADVVSIARTKKRGAAK